jgi:hypothetical protein
MDEFGSRRNTVIDHDEPTSYTSPPNDPLASNFHALAPSDVVATSTGNLDRYTFNHVEQQQEDIRDAREHLMGYRFRLRKQRKELSEIREQAAYRAGAAFTLIRQHIINFGPDVITEIKLALEEAEAIRNDLGNQESEYLEAEKVYDEQEWTYTTKEAKFVEDLPQNIPAQAQRSGAANTANRHSEDNAPEPFGRQDIGSLVAQAGGDSLINMYEIPRLLDQDDDDGISEDHSTLLGDIHNHSKISRCKDPASEPQAEHDPVARLVFEDLALSQSGQKWANTRKHIDDWFLDSLDASVYEKARLKNYMAAEHLSYHDWYNLVRHQWFASTNLDSAFHTGDTTVSGESNRDTITINATRTSPKKTSVSKPSTKNSSQMARSTAEHLTFMQETNGPSSSIKPRSPRGKSVHSAVSSATSPKAKAKSKQNSRHSQETSCQD